MWWMSTRYGLVNVFTDHLYTPIPALSPISTLHEWPQHLLNISNLLCLHHPFPGNGFLQWRFFSFRLRIYLHIYDSTLNWLIPNYGAISSHSPLQISTELAAPGLFSLTPRRGPRRQHPLTPLYM
jgi:hypothetical protein